MTEKQYENKIKKWLKDNSCWYIKYWGGGQFTKAGVPDLLCCINGRFVAIEVKSETGTASDLQVYNIGKIISSGGVGIITKPSDWEQLKKMLEKIKTARPWGDRTAETK